MYTQISTINEQVKYSNTYNVFVKIYSYKSQNNEWRNSEINEKAAQAYTKGKTIFTFTSASNLLQQVIFYNGIIHCFAIINSYRVLYNYLLPSELGIDDEIDLINNFNWDKVNFLNELSFIDNKAKVGDVTISKANGEKSLCKVINTYEAFLDYTTKKALPIAKRSNTQFLNNFVENLSLTKINQRLINYRLGGRTYNPNSGNLFTYIYFQNIIIITGYSKEPLFCPF